jgi:hypothetical protein
LAILGRPFARVPSDKTSTQSLSDGNLAYALQVPPVKRILAVAAALVGALLYVWVAAVRAVPRVKRRKAARRAARRYEKP